MAYDKTPLSKEELEKFRAAHPEWEVVGKAIQRTYVFKKFLDGIEFVRQVAQVAEKHDHHPDIDIRYTKVTVTLSTHDAGGVTELDVQLASAMDKIAGN